MTFRIVALLLFALVGGGAVVLAFIFDRTLSDPADRLPAAHLPAKPAALTVGLDLSAGSPIVADPAFATRAGARIADEIAALPPGSSVRLRTFGDYGANANPFAYDRTISKRYPAAEVARTVGGIVAGVPDLVSRGRLEVQGGSNILPFVTDTAAGFDCTATAPRILLVTDGIEQSDLADLTALATPSAQSFAAPLATTPLATAPLATAPLPTAPEAEAPKAAAAGDPPAAESIAPLPAPRGIGDICATLTLLGVGRNTPGAAAADAVRDAWLVWARAAGFPEVTALKSW